jgi:hypothetical protein
VRRWLSPIPVLVLLLAHASEAQRPPDGPASDFRAQALYRAVSLTWKVRTPSPQRLTFAIVRADTFVEGPYTDVTTIESTPGKTSYEYVDKSIGTEAKYVYKLTVKETGQTLGPITARPYFSPPAT